MSDQDSVGRPSDDSAGTYSEVDFGPGRPPGGPAGRGSRRSRKGLVAGGAGAAFAILAAGAGAYAWTALSGGGPQPAEALPASTLAYARIDLDPSAGQKVNLVRLLRKIPEFEDTTGIRSDRDDLRKRIVDEAVKSSGCSLDYEQDVKPWIGDRAAVAAVPVAGEPRPVFALATTSASAARKGIAKLAECGGEPVGVAAVGDYVLVAEEQSYADAAATEARRSALSDDSAFRDDMDELGNQGVASFWVDGKGLAQLGRLGGADTAALRDQDLDSAAGSLRAGGDYAEIVAVARQTSPLSSSSRTDVGTLPDSTLLAASVAGGATYVDRGWSALTTSSGPLAGHLQSELDAVEQATGVRLPDDLSTLLGRSFTLALDERGLAEADSIDDASGLADLGFGVRMTTDPDRAARVVAKVDAKLVEAGGPRLATRSTDDSFVVATNPAYAKKLAGRGALGNSLVFKKVVPDAANALAVLYLDVDKTTAIAHKVGRSADAEEVKALEAVQAVGMSASASGDHYTRTTMRVSFD